MHTYTTYPIIIECKLMHTFIKYTSLHLKLLVQFKNSLSGKSQARYGTEKKCIFFPKFVKTNPVEENTPTVIPKHLI